MWQAIGEIAKRTPDLLRIGMGLYSGSQGSRAVGAATNIQAGQAGENAALERDLAYRLNPYIQQNAELWSGNVRDRSEQAAADVTQAGQGATDYARQTAAGAGDRVRATADRASALLDPYGAAGGTSTQSLLDLASGLNAPQEKFQFSEDDPSYQWRLQQGQQALERSAAGRGGLQSGATLKALTNYSQGAASQEYQAAFNRFMEGQKHGLERSRLAGDTLSGLANRGLLANTQQGKYLTEAEKEAGDWAMNAAKYGGDWQTRASEAAGKFGTEGARYQSDAMINAHDKQMARIFGGERAGMGYMTDRARFLAGGQLGQEANQQAGLSQAVGGFNDLLYQPWGQPGGQGMGTGGISPADEYYKNNPWTFPQPGPAPSVGRSSDSFWEDYWNDRAR